MIETIFNLVEGLWWIGLGIFILTFRNRASRKHMITLALVLICFGLSDFIEIWSGAWWQPLWLLAVKAMCLIAAPIILILMRRQSRRSGY
ncbi:MAG: hypothetical protein LLF76_08270 [Planctomycetaceae bacterium]|nr:hypothetical protein [Planctomycetaceae bacterium]